MTMRLLLVFSLLSILSIQARPALADTMTAEDLLLKHTQATSSLQDVQAQAHLKLNLVLGFLPYAEKLQGRYFYKQPNMHRLEFDNAPSYFSDAPDMFSWKLPSLEKYKVKILGPVRDPKGNQTYQLLYLPKSQEAKTQSIRCTFQATTWKLLAQETNYKDGGTVLLDFVYLADSELAVMSQVNAKVSIPTYSLTGDALITFSEQRVNRGLDDSVFQKSRS